MESFAVKTIKSVDYIKALDIANFYDKNKNHANRFIRAIFAEEDILKSNATLFVRKSAVNTFMHKDQDVIASKTTELDAKLCEAEAAKRAFENMFADCRRFKDYCIDYYRKHNRIKDFQEDVVHHLYYHIQHCPWNKTGTYEGFIEEGFKDLENEMNGRTARFVGLVKNPISQNESI